ncbi:MAG TPA: hypothetical protein VF426_11435 [Marmoricola sp.]
MSARLETQAEMLKLERLVGVDAGTFEFLEGVDAQELRDLRERVTDSLFDAGGQALAKLGAAAKLLPSPIVANICESSFGPLLSARAAATIDPAKAVDVAKRMSPGFLTDTTIELDPRRVAAIIAGVPADLVEPVATELGQRAEFVTMGRFLAYMPDETLSVAMASLTDEALLRTAFVLEQKEHLDHALGLLEPERIAGILRCAADGGLWPEALDLLDNISDERRAAIAEVIAGLGDDVISGLIAAASDAAIWDSLVPVVAAMSDDALVQLAPTLTGLDAAHLRSLLDAAPKGLVDAVEQAADRVGLHDDFTAAVARAGLE